MTEAETAALLDALGEEMSELSEECWCAGWLTGTEEAVPALCRAAIATGQPQQWGQDEVSVDTARRLTAMAERLGSWAAWTRDGFVPYMPSNEKEADHADD